MATGSNSSNFSERRQPPQTQQRSQFENKFTKNPALKLISHQEQNSNKQSDDIRTLIGEINGLNEEFDMKE